MKSKHKAGMLAAMASILSATNTQIGIPDRELSKQDINRLIDEHGLDNVAAMSNEELGKHLGILNAPNPALLTTLYSKPHWKETQSEEERDKKLKAAEEKRKRKAEKRKRNTEKSLKGKK